MLGGITMTHPYQPHTLGILQLMLFAILLHFSPLFTHFSLTIIILSWIIFLTGAGYDPWCLTIVNHILLARLSGSCLCISSISQFVAHTRVWHAAIDFAYPPANHYSWYIPEGWWICSTIIKQWTILDLYSFVEPPLWTIIINRCHSRYHQPWIH